MNTLDYAKVYQDDDGICLQESVKKKDRWLQEAQSTYPIGTRVRVAGSDLPEQIGLTGSVRGHTVGMDGDWPLISVLFDAQADGRDGDGFYDDEIEIIAEVEEKEH